MAELKTRRSNAAIDLAKYVSSVMILCLHSEVDLGLFQPLFRIAVPCFFLFSSCFLFRKLEKAADVREEKAIMRSFVLRNVQLYAFWFIAQLPFIYAGWEYEGMKTILLALRGLVFGSTFTASWYISATIIGCCIVYVLSKKLGGKMLLGFGAVCYLACLLFSNYYGLIEWCLPLRYAFTAFITVFNSVVTGVPAGILWIIIGKYAATDRRTSWSLDVGVLIASLVGLLLEGWVVDRLGLALRDDQYIMLIPVCLSLFRILCRSQWSWRYSVRLRNMSTIIFASHGTILQIIAMLPVVTISCSPIRAAVALGAATMISIVIFFLEKYRPFSWLKYSH